MKRKFGIALLLLAVVTLALPAVSHAQVAVGVSVRIGPPPIPVYAQPICPGPRYIWAPGYWAYGPDGYYWVPGTWVFAPEPGFLWTPGYWAFADGFYLWHRGYWGPHVGFYGGINYGYGYPGNGFYGGEWRHGEFFYNRSVTNINVTVVHNVYERRVVVRNDTRVSFNGRGGIERGPDRDEMRWDHERHFEPTAEQVRHRDDAGRDRDQWQSVNHGHPGFGATQRPGEFDHHDNGRAEHENRDLHQDNRELRQNNKEMRQNNREVHQNNRELRQNNREQRQQNHENGRPGKPGKPDKDHGHPHGRGL